MTTVLLPDDRYTAVPHAGMAREPERLDPKGSVESGVGAPLVVDAIFEIAP